MSKVYGEDLQMKLFYDLFNVVPKRVLNKVRKQRNKAEVDTDFWRNKCFELDKQIINKSNFKVKKKVATKTVFLYNDIMLNKNKKEINVDLDLSLHKNMKKTIEDLKQFDFKHFPIFKESTRHYRMVDGWKLDYDLKKYNYTYNVNGRLQK